MKMTQNGEIKEDNSSQKDIYSQIEKINIVKVEYSQR